MTETDIAGSYKTMCDFGAKTKQTNDDLTLNELLFWRQTHKIFHYKYPQNIFVTKTYKTVPN
jgi:hypothetical protein